MPTPQVGCNAWGQASLTFAGACAPGLLGYTTLTAEEESLLGLMAAARFVPSPARL